MIWMLMELADKIGNLKKVCPEIRRLLESRKTRFIWIPGEQNAEADLLSNVAYCQSGTKIP
jgi:hypothetical protein